MRLDRGAGHALCTSQNMRRETPAMDSTKHPLGVATMVYGDYFFLKRWYAYYAAQVGAENLFVFSHGNDPKHREIAAGANVIHVPRDPTMQMFDRRRWSMLSQFISGMMRFYNWMILGDVDEIVIVDPDVADGLLPHLRDRYWDAETAPKNISPLCLELVHYPELETEPVEEGATILSRRRTFRPNRNYSKPCLVRAPVTFRAGGHVNNLGKRHLPDDVYTLHLKYFDCHTMSDRGQEKSEMILAEEALNANFATMSSWYAPDAKHADILSNSEFGGEDIALTDFRAAMLAQVDMGRDRYAWGSARNNTLYRLPERFAPVF